MASRTRSNADTRSKIVPKRPSWSRPASKSAHATAASAGSSPKAIEHVLVLVAGRRPYGPPGTAAGGAMDSKLMI